MAVASAAAADRVAESTADESSTTPIRV